VIDGRGDYTGGAHAESRRRDKARDETGEIAGEATVDRHFVVGGVTSSSGPISRLYSSGVEVPAFRQAS
jgi:hypothetical protein